MIKILPKITKFKRPLKNTSIVQVSQESKLNNNESRNIIKNSLISKVIGTSIKEATEDGFKITKYRNGIKKSETIRHNGSKIYEKISFAQNGKISESKKYVAGIIPTLKEHSTYTDGIKTKTIEFLEEVTVTSKFYKNGNTKLIEKQYFDGGLRTKLYREDGTKCGYRKVRPNNDSLVETFYPNEALKCSVEINNSDKLRTKTMFATDGKTITSKTSLPVKKISTS